MAAVSWEIGSQTFYLGSSDYFDGPITSRIAKLIQVIPVDMDTRLYNALQLSAYVLRQGRILCVFPEGTRARDGKLHGFKKGVGIIARELNVPIVPVAIRGTYEMLAPGKAVLKPAKVTVTFGKPVLPGDRDYDEIVKDLYERVAGMQLEVRS
jgi:long-chain acyl-CoA synthetase